MEEVVCTVSLAVIVSLVIVQVFYRYVLFSGILWIDELVTNLMVLMVLFGAALATRNKVHTDLQLFVTRSSRTVSLGLRLIGAAVTGLFLLTLIYFSSIYVYNSRGLSTTVIKIPLWIVYGMIPIGGVLIFYEFVKTLREGLFTDLQQSDME